ncbi:putative LRR receptor-like serine/threonine-protein kinase [Dorcoceras hygrometricum]|uniref:Putative LRR receptor-like serine/threonine-protein kinase n=1 Tax=Dorcoceras hygrometricum TaxID=472368 RepID=A0A2Z7CXA0_9LAMI|nr:putative LRR receptor-like serine/threonine-protein kinase [Dorcoceras hygrometricum]
MKFLNLGSKFRRQKVYFTSQLFNLEWYAVVSNSCNGYVHDAQLDIRTQQLMNSVTAGCMPRLVIVSAGSVTSVTPVRGQLEAVIGSGYCAVAGDRRINKGESLCWRG